MSEDNTKHEKLILHLKYTISIFILLSCTVGGLALYNQDLAIKSLSTAGLLTSIVLAVIAILITLWDVAGQRNNVLTMKETVDDFKEIIGDFQEISEDNEVAISELKDVIVEMNEKIIAYEGKFTQLQEKIESSTDKELKAEVKKIKNERLQIINNRMDNNKFVPVARIYKKLKEKYGINKELSDSVLRQELRENMDVQDSFVQNTIDSLIHTRRIVPVHYGVKQKERIYLII